MAVKHLNYLFLKVHRFDVMPWKSFCCYPYPSVVLVLFFAQAVLLPFNSSLPVMNWAIKLAVTILYIFSLGRLQVNVFIFVCF